MNRLVTKFSMLLAASVLIPTASFAWLMSRFIVADQRAYVSDHQATLALFIGRELKLKVGLLHSEVGALLKSEQHPLAQLKRGLPAIASGTLWKNREIVERIGVERTLPLPEGSSEWAILPSEDNVSAESIRWIGRYGEMTVDLELPFEWLEETLEGSKGSTAVLLDGEGAPLSGKNIALPASSAWLPQYPGVPMGSDVKLPNQEHQLATVLGIDTQPRMFLALLTPQSEVTAVVARTYRYTLGLGAFFLALAIVLGIAFSAHLTQPLRFLDRSTVEIAEGHFDLDLGSLTSRRDEVGRLAGSFNRMGTKLKALQTEIQRTERLATLGKFSASLAHEIKNPLAGVLCNVQVVELLLKKKDLGDNEVGGALGLIKEEALRANRTITDLMKYARHDRPKNRVNLRDRVRRSLQILNSQIEQAGVKLDLQAGEASAQCLGSEDQLHEVITNLVQNALYAMKDSPLKRLAVTLDRTREGLRLRVGDSGAGIPPEIKEHLFEPFQTSKPIGQGTGLGLSVCHGIVRNHMGRIDVESSPGNGTTFTIILPELQEESLPQVA